jgi:cysteine desulfurase
MRIRNALYFDHHSTTPVDPKVLHEMLPLWQDSFGNPHSSDHAFGWAAMRAVEHAAAKVGALLGCDGDEIIFTSGATEANNLALFGLAHSELGAKRHRILLNPIDHKSILAAGRALLQQGFVVETLRVSRDGLVDVNDLRSRIGPDVLLVSIGLVNSEIGVIQNLAEIASVVRESGTFLHCDAAQAPCAMDCRRVAAAADLVSLSAHKIYGPQGVGALYVRRDLQPSLRPQIYGGGQQNNIRSGTLPVALCAGFGAAADLLAGETAEAERRRIAALRDTLLEGLAELSWPIVLNGAAAPRHPGNANILFEGVSAEDLLGVLQPGLAASTGSACISGTPEPSYVLRAIGLDNEQAASSVRFCIGRFTTEKDVRDAVTLIAEGLAKIAPHIATTAAE